MLESPPPAPITSATGNTGTGLVPPDSFSLVPGNWVEIHVPEVGTLVNPVALATLNEAPERAAAFLAIALELVPANELEPSVAIGQAWRPA